MLSDSPSANANGLDRNPYVFVVGCARSGTTLLQRMLNSHPRMAVANDTHFIPGAIPGLEPGSDPALTPSIVESVSMYKRFYRLGLSDDAVRDSAMGAGTFSEFVSGLYTQLGNLHGKPLAGEKTPSYVRYLPLLHALFPQAKTVHIIRDGRDVALSTLEWAHENKGPGRFALWKDHPVAVCAQWWDWQVSTGQRDARALGPRLYHEVYYEDLVARPEAALRRIADFLDLPYAPEMLTFYEGKMRDEPNLSSKKRWLPPTPGLRDWRSHMAPRDVELFEALAGDLLTDLGYERGATVISDELAEVAERCRAWWQTEMARKARRRRRTVSEEPRAGA